MANLTNFSRSNRTLILTVDMVGALADTLQADNGPMPQKTARCVTRIQNRIQNIQAIVYGGPQLVLAPGVYRKYKRIIISIKKLIDGLADDVVELDFFNAVLVLVEDARVNCRRSKNKRLLREWTYLNQSLATLYGHLDPDLSEIKWMALGENLAGRFKKMMVAA